MTTQTETKIEKGTEVEWESGAAGTTKTKRGTVVAVIPQGSDPRGAIAAATQEYGSTSLNGVGGYRTHESYLVLVPQVQIFEMTRPRKPVLYWPLVKKLQVVR